MHLHKPFLRHGDDLILLIKIGIAHKERTWSQTTINTFKKFMGEEGGIETQSKVMVATKWWLFSQLQM